MQSLAGIHAVRLLLCWPSAQVPSASQANGTGTDGGPKGTCSMSHVVYIFNYNFSPAPRARGYWREGQSDGCPAARHTCRPRAASKTRSSGIAWAHHPAGAGWTRRAIIRLSALRRARARACTARRGGALKHAAGRAWREGGGGGRGLRERGGTTVELWGELWASPPLKASPHCSLRLYS